MESDEYENFLDKILSWIPRSVMGSISIQDDSNLLIDIKCIFYERNLEKILRSHQKTVKIGIKIMQCIYERCNVE